ncbi:FxSxx-COOH system tetratricopeptide repeat protein [Streptomyces sp. NRRL WC-3742]|uniref:FxSxx-COOH system tetratricopeptide repeat protein n=1 Tax=Streptomyces sp. NRRL WC-3742 TaxID=1463934 RepID=UPI0004C6D3D9|nr:FxSxx-COOH system tetratricopeptide repeat protein [Streptomyces sp. NRRL WC-3742]
MITEPDVRPERGPGSVVTFYSFKGGTGRTMALANVGWILASRGLRVLVVDWDLEAPGLHRYYHPLLVDPELHSTDGLIDLLRSYVRQALPSASGPTGLSPAEWLDVPGRLDDYICGLALDLPPGGRLDFLPAGRQNAAYAAAVTSFNWRSFYHGRDIRGGEFLRELRERWARNYDYVLIDSRTGVSDTSGICTVLMPDTVVDCFTFNAQNIRGGVAAAHTIADTEERAIRVMPVPMRVEDAEQERLEAGRDFAREAFAPYLGRWLGGERRAAYWADVEVPYKPFYAYEEVPATVADRPQEARSLLNAFERLAGWITDGRVRNLRPLGGETRRRLYGAYLRSARAVPRQVFVSYAPENRMWAEWAAATLTRFGYQTSLHNAADPYSGPRPPEVAGPAGGQGRLLALISPEYTALPRAAEVWQHLYGGELSTGAPTLVALRLQDSDDPVPRPFAGHVVPDLTRSAAVHAEAQLYHEFGQAPGTNRVLDGDSGEFLAPARFPGDAPKVLEVRSRNASFIGRGRVLELLRNRFTGGPAAVRSQVLYGLGGAGKSEIAGEYAHRFKAAYDVVWWVPAEDPANIPAELAKLAPRLGVPGSDDVAHTAAAVLDALRRGQPHSRWLLVFDNASTPEELAPWLPAGASGGHVLITSRNQGWSKHAGLVEVDVFLREESVRLLRRFNHGLSAEDAEQIASRLGDLPLAVGQAAVWLQETPMRIADYLGELDRALTEMLERTALHAADYPHSAAATLRISVEELRRMNAPAAQILEICAFLGPDAIPMRLLYSRAVVRALKLPPRAPRDKLAIGELLRAINRFGLARTDQGSETITVHRLVQAVLRDQVGDARQAELREVVHAALAAANPGDPDVPTYWAEYSELLPHLWPSGAVDSADEDVRQWIIDSVRYQWKRSLHEAGRELAERTLRHWRQDGYGGPGFDVDNDAQTLMLRTQLSNIRRSQGALQEAYEMDRDILERFTETLGPEHSHTLAVANSLGADLRFLGRYDEARALDRRTLDAARRTLGPDHPRTLMITNNLAVSDYLAGDRRAALERHRSNYLQQRDALGAQSLYALSSASNYARDLRETGRLREALDLLEETVRTYQQTIGDNHTDTLRARKNLAVALRRDGRYHEALEIDEDIYRRYLDINGPEHPDTLAAATNLASDFNALGDTDRAIPLAERALARYRDYLGEDHPVTLAGANNLSVYLRLAGRLEEARDLSRRTLTQFRAVLGEHHLYIPIAMMNHANDLAVTGEPQAALALETEAAPMMVEALGSDHYDSIGIKSNLALSLAAVGDADRAAELRADCIRRARATLGDEHPTTKAVRAGTRLDSDVEPPHV